MKSWALQFSLIIIAVFLFLRFGPGLSFTSTVTQKQDLFTVTGEGKVTVVPDTAIVTLGVTTTQNTVKSAQNQTNIVIKNITQELKNLGVADKDVKTSNYSIYPQYDIRHITGYTVSANLTVTVRNLDKINDVIDKSTAAGANTIGNVQLTVDDKRLKELEVEARAEAIKDAKAKANSLSSASGLSLGKLVNVQESPANQPRPYLMTVKMEAVGLGGGAPETSIQPGSTDITSSVALSYETR